LKAYPQLLKVYPKFFDEDDPLRTFLDAGGAEKLAKIDKMRQYQSDRACGFEISYCKGGRKCHLSV
jgi:hypothetical protein